LGRTNNKTIESGRTEKEIMNRREEPSAITLKATPKEKKEVMGSGKSCVSYSASSFLGGGSTCFSRRCRSASRMMVFSIRSAC
jgi:hypothetical protein